MNATTKTQEEERSRLIGALREAGSELESAIDKANDDRLRNEDEVREALDRYRDIAQEAAALRDEIVREAQDYFGERSEKWQEGEKGQNYQSWIESFEALSLDEIDMDFPTDIELPDMPAADELEQVWQSRPE